MSLPSYVPSLLGLVPVYQGDGTDESLTADDLLGTWSHAHRHIQVRSDMSPVSQNVILGHEIMHMILDDSGMNPLLNKKVLEGVCDAFGTWFASALESGKLSLK